MKNLIFFIFAVCSSRLSFLKQDNFLPVRLITVSILNRIDAKRHTKILIIRTNC